MAAHVREHAAAGAIDIPEVGRMGAVVLLRLLDEGRAAKRTGVEQRLHPHVLRREAHLLGIHEEHAGVLAGGDHAVGLGHAQAHGLLQHDVLACSGAVQHQRAVSVVGRADHHHVDIVALQQRAVICAVVGEAVRFCESLGVPRRRRCHRDQLRVGVAHERAGMKSRLTNCEPRNPTPTGFVIDCLALAGVERQSPYYRRGAQIRNLEVTACGS